jgi:hypothetical protein
MTTYKRIYYKSYYKISKKRKREADFGKIGTHLSVEFLKISLFSE